jgi:hypothetical protein
MVLQGAVVDQMQAHQPLTAVLAAVVVNRKLSDIQ